MNKILLFFLLPLAGAGQHYGYLAGGRSAALAHSSVAIEDVWATHHNQAALGFLKDPVAAVSYAHRYFLKELAIGNAAFAYPLKTGTVGLSLTYFGFSLYNQSRVGINYSRSFGRHLSFGLQLNYENFYVAEGSPGPGAITVEAGVLGKPLPELNIAFHLYNPSRSFKNSETEEYLPLIGRLGAQYHFTEEVALTTEIKKQENRPERYSLGLEYRFMKLLSLRAGVAVQPLANTFGLGLNLSNFQINTAYEYTRVLGSNATVSIEYKL